MCTKNLNNKKVAADKVEIFCFPLKICGWLPNEAFANDKRLSQCDAKSREAGKRDGQETAFKQSSFSFWS